MLKVAVLVSGGGTNLQAIIDGIENGSITNAKIDVVISNNKNAYALERAKKHNIEAVALSPKDFETRDLFNEALYNELVDRKIDLIVNRIRMDMVESGNMMSMDDVVEILAIDMIGAVPDDENIVIATNQGEPCVGDSSLAGQAYMNICKRIMGEEVPFLDLKVRTGIFEKLKKLFK